MKARDTVGDQEDWMLEKGKDSEHLAKGMLKFWKAYLDEAVPGLKMRETDARQIRKESVVPGE